MNTFLNSNQHAWIQFFVTNDLSVCESIAFMVQQYKKTNNEEFKQIADSLCYQYLPSGSGIDNGTTIDWNNSLETKLIFNFSFHHMDGQGYYIGWTDHQMILIPSFIHEIDIQFHCDHWEDFCNSIAEDNEKAIEEEGLIEDTEEYDLFVSELTYMEEDYEIFSDTAFFYIFHTSLTQKIEKIRQLIA